MFLFSATAPPATIRIRRPRPCLASSATHLWGRERRSWWRSSSCGGGSAFVFASEMFTWRALIGLDYVQLQDPTGSKWTLTEAGLQAAGGINPEDLIREPKGMTSHDVLKSLRKLWPSMPMSIEVAVGPTGNPSYADAVFLMGSEGMTAVEVKVNRGDWLAELKDPMKRAPIVAISARFYFATPAGMTLPSELPEGCGLIEVEPRTLKASVTAGAAPRPPPQPDWVL